MAASFTIGVLCYGDYPELAHRCLESIQLSVLCNQEVVKDVRIGINQCSEATLLVILKLAQQMNVPVYGYTAHGEAFKYPIMRAMLYRSLPVRSTHWMWFDDDSFAKPGFDARWLTQFAKQMESIDLAGYRYKLTKGLRLGQAEGIKKQNWYGQRPIQEKQPPFFQGGWWTARYDLLQSWSYPFKELRHNNGDVMLGQLSTQQRWRELTIPESAGPVASNKAPRRGVKDTPWPWEQNGPTDFAHQDVRIAVERLNPLGDPICPLNSEINSETPISTPA